MNSVTGFQSNWSPWGRPLLENGRVGEPAPDTPTPPQSVRPRPVLNNKYEATID